MHSTAVRSDYALCRIFGLRRQDEAPVASHSWCDRLQCGFTGCLRNRLLRRAPSRRALWPLDSAGPPRARMGGPFLRPLGIPCSIHCTSAAGNSNLHCTAGWYCPHATTPLPHLYLLGIMAVVLRAGLVRHETRPKLARAGKVFSQIRCRDFGNSGDWTRLVLMVPLAEPVESRVTQALPFRQTGSGFECSTNASSK